MRLLAFAVLSLAGLSAGAAAKPLPVTVAKLQDEGYENKVVEFTCTIDDVLPDEKRPENVILVLNSGDNVSVANLGTNILAGWKTEDLIGARLRACGKYSTVRDKNDSRGMLWQELKACDGQDFCKLIDPVKDLFNVPPLEDLSSTSAADIKKSGHHRVSGRVEAVWGENKVFLTTAAGNQCRVRLRNGPLPRCGQFVEAAGLPETDLYRINLARAIWRPAAPMEIAAPNVPSNGVGSVISYLNGSVKYATHMYGHPVRIRGIVRSLPSLGSNWTFSLESEGTTVAVDASGVAEALDGPTLGATIDATGLCIFETESWRVGSTFQRMTGFRVVLRRPEDVVLIANPPWWTPAKLRLLIVILLVGLVAVLLRGALQRRVANLRFRDRTRLAIELHDSISQNLTSVSLQVDAARELVPTDGDKALTRLDIASKTIDSCRAELRNCIRDLRDATLDTSDANAAIRNVLAPVLADATLRVRFNVPRRALSDSAAHAMLCIVRELATNAVRHGHT